MDKIFFTDSYDAISDPEVGIRRKHAIETVQSADNIQEIGDTNYLLFTRRIRVVELPYILIVLAKKGKNDQLSINRAFKVYPELVPNIEDKSPLELLDHLVNQFGLKFKIGNSENKKFYLNDKVIVSNFSEKKDLLIDNPRSRETIKFVLFKKGSGIVMNTITCALAFCINIDAYSRWIKSKGKNSSYNKEVLRVQHFAIEKTLPRVIGKEFRDKVFISIHDFCFHCRQHPESLSKLHEELIRDLFLIVIKTVFSTAEGESYHYNGKLDFKVTNPENKYEIITGEFKWWRGQDSAHEILHQSIRKHATGQELDIYTIVLNKNKDANSVFEKIKSIYSDQQEIDHKSFANTAPKGSKEKTGSFTTEIRGNKIPLHLVLADLFFERV